MAKKLKTSTIALAVVGGFAVLVAVDHFVLKGKLGISGRINQILGQLKKSVGIGAGPITAAPPIDMMQTAPAGEEVPTDAEQIAMGEEMGYESVGDPEAAMRARMRRARQARRRVRIGGYGI